MPDPLSTAGPVPPGTENAVIQIVVGCAALIPLALAVATVDIQTFLGTVAVGVAAVFLALGLFSLNAGVQRLRARRAAGRLGPHDWAGVCVQPDRHLLLRTLVVNDTGVQLLTMGGRSVVSWPWSTIVKATPTVAPIGARTPPALALTLTDDSQPTLAFPRSSGIGYSEPSVDSAAAAITVRLGQP